LPVTNGNNAHAYTDTNHDNLPDPAGEPQADGYPPVLFDFPLDLTQDPSTYGPAAVTNLFFWNNYVHDVSYRYGFDEAAGNFQGTNYSGQGVGGDAVNAEAQDGGGTNNANFGTPPDGQAPRMQMFIWTRGQPTFTTLQVTAPDSIAGDKTAVTAAYGPDTSNGDISGPIALSPDGDLCTDVSQSDGQVFAGFVAAADRGTCNFKAKTLHAQEAGASALVIFDNGNPPQPRTIQLGDDNTIPTPITIPTVMITQADGADIKTQIANSTDVDVTVSVPPPVPNVDGDLDNSIIAHEYTHGISNRLTGGPANVSCLTNGEQEGEGWSDFMALVLTAQQSDTATTARPEGAYASGIAAGIRPTPYSTSLAVDPANYDTLKTIDQFDPHTVGFAWTSMLWDMYWNLVGAHGFAPIQNHDLSSGNGLALQLVMDGMKLQPCNPGFVDSRNAILQADQVDTGGQNQCLIWRAFARRGLGVSALQGDPDSITDGTQAFDVPAQCHDAPSIGFATSPLLASGDGGLWFNAFDLSGSGGTLSVTASATASAESSGVQSIACGVDGGTATTASGATFNISALADGTHTVSCTATDNEGFKTPTAATATFQIDTVVPSTSIGVSGGVLGSNAWYTSSPTFTLTPSDPAPASGLATTKYQIDSGSTQTYSSGFALPDGQHTISYWSIDNAGNQETHHTTATIKVDSVDPSTTIAVSPPAPNGDNGWYKGTSPTFTLTPSDPAPGSGLATTKYQIDSGSTQTYNSAVTIPDGQHTISYWSVDNAGNSETTNTTGTISVDTVAPTITCSVASPGPSLQLGASNQHVTASVFDATSLVSGSTSLSAAANTATVGGKTVSFNASDKAGNAAATTSCPYVVGYKFGGFTSPLPKSIINTGSTLPVKFQLQNASGQPISDAEAQSLVSPVCEIAIILVKPAGAVSGCPTYSAMLKQFQFNLKTTSAMKGANGVSITVTIGGTVVTASAPPDPFTVK
jgi:hypothetical protein